MVKLTQTGNRLQELRTAAGISRAGLADYVGVGETQVRRWEVGDVLIPTRHLERLTAKLDVTVEYLLGWDREEVA
ncbi:MAG TPA: helix-turn-helix transcriptional regulator [Solirubrobacterales bacterium]|nr:helix-turn-helix transcriptional regulator [Solirubrobacterales bacterium]